MNARLGTALDRRVNDCWNRIGVRGDGSCAQLERHVHCRNCQVYAAAATELLAIEHPPDYLLENTGLVARPQAREDMATQSLLIFRVGAEWLALPTVILKEVASDCPLRTLPHRRAGIVQGLINIRGELLVCFALEKMLTSQPDSLASPSDKPSAVRRLLVLENSSGRLVCRVDEVHGVRRFVAHALKEAPTNPAKSRASYLRAVVSWNDKTIGVLDESRLLQTVEESLPLVAKT